jgi:putative photosynthetic complex assembly protein
LLDRPLPRGALAVAVGAAALALLTAGTARLTGIGVMPPPVAAAVDSRELRFEDRSDGAVTVLAEPGGEVIDVLAPGTNGFVRGVLRGLARERKRQEIGPTSPFRLTLWDDGRMTLEDPATGRQIGLEAFGPTNFAAFARLLQAGRAAS